MVVERLERNSHTVGGKLSSSELRMKKKICFWKSKTLAQNFHYYCSTETPSQEICIQIVPQPEMPLGCLAKANAMLGKYVLEKY